MPPRAVSYAKEKHERAKPLWVFKADCDDHLWEGTSMYIWQQVIMQDGVMQLHMHGRIPSRVTVRIHMNKLCTVCS